MIDLDEDQESDQLSNEEYELLIDFMAFLCEYHGIDFNISYIDEFSRKC